MVIIMRIEVGQKYQVISGIDKGSVIEVTDKYEVCGRTRYIYEVMPGGCDNEYWFDTFSHSDADSDFAKCLGLSPYDESKEIVEMNRKETTKFLSELVEKLINPTEDSRIYWAREVTFDYATSHRARVDYMKFEPVNNSVSGIEKGDFYCYEVKSSVEDFHSPNGHNFLGDFNYYVMPQQVYDTVRTEIPYGIGVYCPTGTELHSVRNARRRSRERPVSEMLLMMFRSANRDRM